MQTKGTIRTLPNSTNLKWFHVLETESVCEHKLILIQKALVENLFLKQLLYSGTFECMYHATFLIFARHF